MRRLILSGVTTVAAFASIGTSSALAAAEPIPNVGGAEGCVIVNTVGGDTCQYQPTKPGGFIGNDFTIDLYSLETVNVNGVPMQEQVKVATINQAAYNPDCATWSPSSSGGIFNNIDLVVGTGEDNLTAVTFGNPSGDPLPECSL